ncbi:hypothetical protein K7X08_028665 [Anisodus acutangulus]|uniref:Uncharacterized protein n=1 Tax=Anisodus acutangulus TaxID=402998 RepID=A0A9Q1LX80_9SOLA|nr:hypothetical protein K7X08_028665 [Anisodus acutangulus]
MQSNSKDLLHLEAEALTLESKLLLCNRDGGSQSLNLKPDLSDKKPDISSVPQSQFLTKLPTVIDLATSDNETESEESSDEDHEDDIHNGSSSKSYDDDGEESKPTEKDTTNKAMKRKRQSVNRANIVELS